MATNSTFAPFGQLPQELRQQIIDEFFAQHGRLTPISTYATLSNDWQDAVESRNFGKTFTLYPEDMTDFARIVVGRRTRLIQGVSLRIALTDIDTRFWAAQDTDTDTDAAADDLSAIGHWLPRTSFKMQRLIRLSTAVTNVFKCLFRILAAWPDERSLQRLLRFDYAFESASALWDHMPGWSDLAARRPMLLFDFASLAKVPVIGRVFDAQMAGQDSVLPPEATLALLRKTTQVQKAGVTLGVGGGDEWLLDAEGDFRPAGSQPSLWLEYLY